MRDARRLLPVILMLLLATSGLRGAVLSGPVTNAANGHMYYLLTENTWTVSEAEAVLLGGHLATINDAAENQWVFDTFSNYGGVQRGLWIGLTDQQVEGLFAWADGSPLSFTRWADGEPTGGEENWVHIFYPQDTAGRAPGWNDYRDVTGVDATGSGQGWIPFNGVVEVVPQLILRLTIARTVTDPNPVTLSWNGGPGIKLQKTRTLPNPDWQEVAGSHGVSQITVPTDGTAAFFRLVKP